MKKNKRFMLGMAAMALAITLVFAGCIGKNDGGNSFSGGVSAAESLQDASAATTTFDGTGEALSSGAWEQALDNYEAFVDEYVAFMKQYSSNPGDMTLLGKYASMLEQAQQAGDSMSAVEEELSGDDLAKFTERYMKIAAKMATALQ